MASNTIKGITIQIEGKTSGLVNELKKADAALKQTQSALRSVNQALKLDPGNAELIAQKQKLLNSAIEETKQKLATEKQVAEDAKKALEVGDITQEQYAKIQAEVVKTTDKLKKLEEQQKQLGSVTAEQLKATGDKWQKTGDNISEAGNKLMPLTGAIAAVGAASVAAFNDVDKGMDIIIAKTGATGEALEDMESIAKDMATTIPVSFEEAGQAVGEVNTRFGVTGDQLEELSTQFAKFAKLNSVDVSNAIDQTQKALSAFGLGADDAAGLLDRMNKVGQDTGVSMDSLMSGLIQNGTAFQELGLNIDQATILMGQLEKSGANSETVMNGLRKALKNAAKDGKPLNQALEELEDTIKNGTGSMDGLTASYELFGKSGDQIYGAVKNGTISFKDLVSVVDDAGGSVSNTFNATLDGIDSMTMAFNALKEAGAEIGEAIGEVLAPMMEELSDTLKGIAEWFRELDDSTKQIIVTIAAVVAAIAPLLVIIGKVVSIGGTLISGIGKLLTTLPQVVSTVTAIGEGLLTSLATPVGAVIAAVAALVAVIGVLVYHFATEETAVKSVADANDAYADSIKRTEDALKSAGSAESQYRTALEQLQQAEQATGLSGEELYNSVANGTLTLQGLNNEQLKVYNAYASMITAQQASTQASLNAIAAKQAEMGALADLGLAQAKATGDWESFKTATIDAWQQGMLTADQAKEKLSMAMTEMDVYSRQTFAENIPQEIREGLDPHAYENDYQSLKSNWEGWMALLAKDSDTASENIQTSFTDALGNTQITWGGVALWFSGLMQDLENAVEPIKQWISDTFQQAREGANEKWSNIGQWFSDRYNDIVGALSGIVDWFGGAFQSAKDAVTGVWSNIGDFFSNVWQWIKDALNIDEALTWGSDLIDNFTSGIENGFKNVRDTVSRLAQIIKDFIGFSEPDEGPLSNFHTFAPDMIDLFVQGLEDGQPKIQDGVAALSDNIKHQFDGMMLDAFMVGGNYITSLINGLVAELPKLSSITDSVKGEFDKIKDAIVETTKAVHNLINKLEEYRRAQAVVANASESVRDVSRVATSSNSRVATSETGRSGKVGASNSTINYNFNQVNNSPKALSTIEIYRQTKNQFSQLITAKGVKV